MSMGQSRPVDIIVPIFNQPALVDQCLTSICRANSTKKFEIIAIDDCSPDPSIGELLAAYVSKGQVTTIKNEQNLGFTRTVNRGMKLHQNRDVVLLNSDTIVYDGWLDALSSAAYSAARIATANPMTNQRGSHISCYPGLAQPIDGQLEVSDEELNAIARNVNQCLCVEVPTTVGFCMFIRRECIQEVGYFDELNFPIAYGEESDFCYRARKTGWSHVIAGEAFVTHLEGQSFSEKKQKLMREMFVKFAQLHPEVAKVDRDLVARDPVRRLRANVDLGRIKQLLGANKFIDLFDVRSERTGLAAAWLTLDGKGQTISISVREATETFPNLRSYNLPADVALLNRALLRLSVETVRCESTSIAEMLRQSTRGLPVEMCLNANIVVSGHP